MPFILNIWRPVQECCGRSGNIYDDYDDIRTKGWDFNTVFYSCRCEYYINTSCRMTQIKDTSISFKSEQCHVCYHYLSSLTSSYRDMLAAVLTVRHMWDTLATGIRWRWSWCLYVQAVCNMSLRDINVSQC